MHYAVKHLKMLNSYEKLSNLCKTYFKYVTLPIKFCCFCCSLETQQVVAFLKKSAYKYINNWLLVKTLNAIQHDICNIKILTMKYIL